MLCPDLEYYLVQKTETVRSLLHDYLFLWHFQLWITRSRAGKLTDSLKP